MATKEARLLELGEQIIVAGFWATVVGVEDISMGWHRVDFRNSGSIGRVDFRSDADVKFTTIEDRRSE